MSDNERKRIIEAARSMGAVSRGAVITYVAGHSGNSLHSLRKALGLTPAPVADLRAAIVTAIYGLQ